MLMTATVMGLSMSLVSCFDNIDNNGGKTPEEQEDVVQSKADKYWSVVSQLVSTDDYTPDYEGKTFEPVYGVAQEGDPTTRLVYTNDVATAAERFADIVEKEGIDENTQTYTFDDPDIGTLTYTKGDENGAILATVDVDIKQIPSLKKIIYVPGGLSNGHFEGKAYYRFGDVVSRKTTDYDGDEATEYWVCVRPAFGPEGKEESHWVCLNVLPKKNVYHYKGSNGTDYYLPTGIGTNKEHMQNLAEMIFAILKPEDWYQNITQYASIGLEMFHDFSVDNIKYHNQYFWRNVQKAWKKKKICDLAFNASYDAMSESTMVGLYMFYSGYSWWTTTSWKCSLNEATFLNEDWDNMDKKNWKAMNMHVTRYTKRTADMRDIVFDCREMGSTKDNYLDFLSKSGALLKEHMGMHWAVRHATGKELCANGRYDVKQRLNGCEDVYRYYHDINPSDDLTEDPEVTSDTDVATNAPTDGQGTYMLGDVVLDKDNNRWFCINGSPWSPLMSTITDRNAWFVSTEFLKDDLKKMDKNEIAANLPSEDELPELIARLLDGFILTATSGGQKHFVPGINGQLGDIMENVKKYADVDWNEILVARDSTWTFTSKGKTYESKSTSLMFNLAYRDSEGEIAIARIIKDWTQAGSERSRCVAVREDGSEVGYKDIFTRVYKYYRIYRTDMMRDLTPDEKYLGMNSWCLPWMISDHRMRLADLEKPATVAYYGKSDKWVTLPLHHVGTTNTKREEPRTASDISVNPYNYIGNYELPRSDQKLGMYNEPILFLRVMKVEDKGGKIPNLTSTDHKKLEIVHLQDDASLYRGMFQNMQWVSGYSNVRNDCFYLDDELHKLPAIAGCDL
jgi:hypothetical protein